MATKEAEVAGQQMALKYDYDQIAPGHRERVIRAAQTIHEANKTAIDSIIKIGQELFEVKKRIDHGQFTGWIEGEFDLSERMAQNYMNVARTYGEGQNRNIISLFSPTVAYMLAAPGVPDEAREEVEQVATTQRVTVEFAKDVIQKHRPEPPAYVPVWRLEGTINAWLSVLALDHDNPDLALSVLTVGKASTYLSKLEQHLQFAEMVYRKDDLTQAINNVREQRRKAKRQAEAKVVYVGPAPITIEQAEAQADAYYSSILGPLPTLDDEEAAARAEVEPTPAQPTPADWDSAIVELLISPTIDVTNTLPNSLHWAVEQASAAQLEQALTVLPDGLRSGRGPVLEAALRKLGQPWKGQVIAEPDPRLRKAQALRDWLAHVRDMAQADYADLTGTQGVPDTDVNALELAIEPMIERLDSLIGILSGGQTDASR